MWVPNKQFTMTAVVDAKAHHAGHITVLCGLDLLTIMKPLIKEEHTRNTTGEFE